MVDWNKAKDVADSAAGLVGQLAMPKLEGELTDADTDPTLSRHKSMMKRAGLPEPEERLATRKAQVEDLFKDEFKPKQSAEHSERRKQVEALFRGEDYIAPRKGGAISKAFDYAKDNLVAGVVAATNTVVPMIQAIPVGWQGLGKIAMGQDPDKVSQWMEKQYFSIHAKDPQAQRLAEQSQHLIQEGFDKLIPAPFAYAYGKSSMNAGLMNEEQFQEHMSKWGSLHGISNEWAKTQGLEPRPIRDEAGEVVGWTQPEATYWQAFGSAVIQLGPWILLGEAAGASRVSPAAKRASGKGYMSAADLANLEGMLKDPQFSKGQSTRSKAVHGEGMGVRDLLKEAEAEVAAEKQAEAKATKGADLVTEATKEAKSYEIPDVTKGVDDIPTRPTPNIEGMNVPEIPETPSDFSRAGPGEKPFVPETSTAALDRLNKQVEVTPKDPTPLPEATTLSEPSYIDARSGVEHNIFSDRPHDPMGIEVRTHRSGEPAKVHTEDGKTFHRTREGKYVEQGVKEPIIYDDLVALRTKKTIEVTEGTPKTTEKIVKQKAARKGEPKPEKAVDPKWNVEDKTIIGASLEQLKTPCT
jgi:hypothetical protein